MKLTDIRLSTSENRLLLVLENGAKLRVWKQTAMDLGLYCGKELDEDELSALQKAAKRDSARERAVRIVSSTSISKKQLCRRLQQKGETADDAGEAVEWLEGLNFLDDRRTGEMLVRSAVNKGYGEKRIRQILWEKQIPQEYWDELMADLPDFAPVIDKLLQQKLKDPEDRKEVQRTVNALQRYGHNWSDIRAGLERRKIEMEEPECL